MQVLFLGLMRVGILKTYKVDYMVVLFGLATLYMVKLWRFFDPVKRGGVKSRAQANFSRPGFFYNISGSELKVKSHLAAVAAGVLAEIAPVIGL
jgi:hypothetical protein